MSAQKAWQGLGRPLLRGEVNEREREVAQEGGKERGERQGGRRRQPGYNSSGLDREGLGPGGRARAQAWGQPWRGGAALSLPPASLL